MNTGLDGFLSGFDGPEMISVSSFKDRKLFIYGAGIGFCTFSTFVLTKYALNPTLVLDQKFGQPNIINGLPSCHPEKFDFTEQDKCDGVVVVTLGSQLEFKRIKDYLETGLGFKYVVWAFEIYEYSLHHTSRDDISCGSAYINENKEKIITAYELLSDEQSRLVFKSILATYYFKKRVSIPSKPLDEQYFPKDIVLSKGFSCFIDGGAYVGDTVEQIINKKLKVENLFCFEPDHQHYLKLVEKVNGSVAASVYAIPCGLYSTEKILSICSSETNSSLSEFGDAYIQVMSLDHFLNGVKPTYIKMDIEGAELDALHGAKRTIKESKADLAISAYHKISHLWELLLYINELGVYDTFYLRNYTSYVAESVLYATSS